MQQANNTGEAYAEKYIGHGDCSAGIAPRRVITLLSIEIKAPD